MIRRQPTSAFTLVELVAAMLIMALLATAVAVSWAGSRSKAELEDVVEQVVQQDRLMRAVAIAQDKACQLRLDLSKLAIARFEVIDGQLKPSHAYVLPAGFAIRAVWTQHATRKVQRATGGQVPIDCSALGYTPSYAVQLSDDKGRKRWLVFAGLSGAVFSDEMIDEQQVQTIFEALAKQPNRDDAD